MDSKIKIVILVCVLVLAAVIDETGHAEEGDAGKAPMALWTFEEPVEALQFHGAPDKTVWTARTDQAIVRRGGVRGHALDLRGNHAIWAGAFDRSRMSALSIMVWVRPLDLTGFREIFRQESDDRVLFSFQDSGNILSLGLNVNGYVECDARIAPKQILDGTWHHCAGTFDGHTMRVFLDGKEIGALERPGSIALSPGLPAFIGSMGGTNEHFQGGLDELRLYDVALGAEEIMGLFRQGLASISENSKRLDIAAGKLYVEAPSFSETVANTRKNLRMRGPAADPDLTDALEARLRTAFPDECAAFFEWTGTTAGALLSQDESLNEAQARRLIELMLEYKPLTEYQKQKQS
ncbi:MAG TPA: LamG domain-containing protein, partial [Candidatus Hydrogenedentes bacterium]|nr:LamG domain-containing protein [Candidatus Hydrogenedentota bacterium]